MISLQEFLEFSNQEVAEIIKAYKKQTCVFPFNGTRRWFLLEHADKAKENFIQSYIKETVRGYVRVYKLLFEHGIENVIAPVFGSEILRRGEAYMEQIGASMVLLAEHPEFLSFYQQYDICVHFYGDYRKELQNTKYAYITEQFDKITAQTENHKKHKLFYGVFASDATQSIAEFSVKHYKETGQVPTRNEIVEAYYGENLEKADLFIGFEKFSVYDYPMLNLGEENLYFTVAPSLYITKEQLRCILYDHIYLRSAQEPEYLDMKKENIEAMRKFYIENKNITFGIGEIRNGIWYSKMISNA